MKDGEWRCGAPDRSMENAAREREMPFCSRIPLRQGHGFYTPAFTLPLQDT